MEGFVPLPTLNFSTGLGLQNETFFLFPKLFILLDAQIFGTADLCCLRSLLGTAGAAWDRLLARASWLWGCSQPGWMATSPGRVTSPGCWGWRHGSASLGVVASLPSCHGSLRLETWQQAWMDVKRHHECFNPR